MSDSILNIKIKTFIEGVAQLQALTQQLQALHTQTGQIGTNMGGGLSNLSNQLNGLNNATTGLGGGLNNLHNSSGLAGRGLASITPNAAGAGSQLMAMAEQVKPLLYGLLALAGIKLSFDYLKDAANYAARTETLGVTLGVVASNAGYSSDEISKYEKEVKKMGITTQAARESMTKMIQAGLPLGPLAGETASNVSKLARASQDLAVVTGENSSDTMLRLITNIQQLDTMGLRFMGLTVDVATAQATFAQSIGKTADALTQQQKIMAVNNKALEEAAKLQGAYELSMETVGKKVASLARYTQELSDAVGKKLLPAYGGIVDEITSMLSHLEKMVSATNENTENSEALGEALRSLTSEFGAVVEAIVQFGLDSGDAFTPLATNLAGIIADTLRFSAAIIRMVNETGLLRATMQGIAAAIALVRDGLTLFQVVGYEALSLIAYGLTMVNYAGGLVVKTLAALKVPKMAELAEEIDRGTASLRKMAQESHQSGVQLITNMANGQSATADLVNGIERARVSLSDFGKATDFKSMSEEIDKFKANFDSLSPADRETAAQRVKEDFLKLTTQAKLSADQVSILRKELDLPEVKSLKNLNNELKDLAKEAAKASAEVAAMGTKTSKEGIEEEIQKLIAYQREGKVTSVEATLAIERLSGSVSKLKETNGATAKEVGALQQKLNGLSGTLTSGFNKAIQEMGTSTSELASGVEPKFAAIAANLVTLGSDAKMTGDMFVQAFSKEMGTAKTVNELAAISVAIREAEKAGQQFLAAGEMERGADKIKGAQQAADAASVSFAAMFDTSLKGAKTEQDLTIVANSLTTLRDTGVITSATLDQSLERITVRLEELRKAAVDSGIQNALTSLGTSTKELTTGVTDSGQKMADAFTALTTSASLTSEEIYRAFSKGLDMAKTFEDVSLAKAKLKEMADSGKISGDELIAANKRLEQSFASVFNKDLGAAKTSEDLEQLAAKVRKAGENGDISRRQMSNFLTDIRKKAGDATAEMARLANQSADIAKGDVSVAKAHLDVVQKNVAVTKAHTELARAQNKVKYEGTEAAQAELRIAEQRVKVAEAERTAADMALRTELAAMDEKIAKQKVINQTKKMENEKNNTPEGQALLQAYEETAAIKEKQLAEAQERQSLAERDVAIAQEGVALEEEKLELIKQQNEEKGGSTGTGSPSPFRNVNGDRTVSGGGSGGGGGSVQSTASPQGQQAGQGLSEAPEGDHSFAAALNAMVTTTSKAQTALKAAGYSESYSQNMGAEISSTFGRLSGGWDDLFLRISSAKGRLDQLVEDARKGKEQAQAFSDQYSRAKQYADDVANGLVGVADAQRSVYDGSGEIANMYNQIKRDAASTAKSAQDTAKGFSNSMQDIQLELLSAEGKDAEVAKAKMRRKEQEITLEYSLLKAKLQGAKIQAQAAGVSTVGIDQALANVEASYSAGMSANAKLNKLELQGIATKKAEEAKARAEKYAAESAERRKSKKDEDSLKLGDSEKDVNKEKEDGDRLVRRSNVMSLDEARKRLSAERQITEEKRTQYSLAASESEKAAQSPLEAFFGSAIPTSTLASEMAPTSALRSHKATSDSELLSQGVMTSKNSGTDVQRVVLEFGGRKAEVTTNNKQDLLGLLEELRLTSMKG